MYDLESAQEFKNILTKEKITDELSDYEIFAFYLGFDFRIGKAMSSPFRKDDVPSWSVYKSKSGKLRYTDFATGEGGQCFDFVKKMFGLSFYETLIKINNDFNLGFDYNTNKYNGSNISVKTEGFKTNTKYIALPEKKDLGIKAQPFTIADKTYWESYGITVEMLKYYNIFSCNKVFLGDRVIYRYDRNNPAYAYLFFKDGRYTYKIYRPLEPTKCFKWMSNTNKTILQGWDQLPKKGNTLIITKALKDVIVLRTLGYYSLALQSEVSSIKNTVVDELYSRFDKIYILQDFDLAGVSGTNRLRKKYGFHYIFLQNFKTRNNQMKDISDYRQRNSIEDTKEIVNKLITLKIIEDGIEKKF
tara:strand:- start:11355 stop:12431 length:1077 start_codon:yes stop_codon:yes gene_type:complete